MKLNKIAYLSVFHKKYKVRKKNLKRYIKGHPEIGKFCLRLWNFANQKDGKVIK